MVQTRAMRRANENVQHTNSALSEVMRLLNDNISTPEEPMYLSSTMKDLVTQRVQEAVDAYKKALKTARCQSKRDVQKLTSLTDTLYNCLKRYASANDVEGVNRCFKKFKRGVDALPSSTQPGNAQELVSKSGSFVYFASSALKALVSMNWHGDQQYTLVAYGTLASFLVRFLKLPPDVVNAVIMVLSTGALEFGRGKIVVVSEALTKVTMGTETLLSVLFTSSFISKLPTPIRKRVLQSKDLLMNFMQRVLLALGMDSHPMLHFASLLYSKSPELQVWCNKLMISVLWRVVCLPGKVVVGTATLIRSWLKRSAKIDPNTCPRAAVVVENRRPVVQIVQSSKANTAAVNALLKAAQHPKRRGAKIDVITSTKRKLPYAVLYAANGTLLKQSSNPKDVVRFLEKDAVAFGLNTAKLTKIRERKYPNATLENVLYTRYASLKKSMYPNHPNLNRVYLRQLQTLLKR